MSFIGCLEKSDFIERVKETAHLPEQTTSNPKKSKGTTKINNKKGQKTDSTDKKAVMSALYAKFELIGDMVRGDHSLPGASTFMQASMTVMMYVNIVL